MKITKYNHLKEGQVKLSSVVGGGGGSSSTTIQGGSTSLDRTIWGKHDTGEDIDGHMIVSGDITVKACEIYEDDENHDPDAEFEDYDEGGGNLTVEAKTTTKELEVLENAYIQKHLYINHTHDQHSGEKVCLVGEVEKNTKDIASNLAEITTLKTKVSTNETNIKNNADDIAELKTKTSTNETNITNINNVLLTESEIVELIKKHVNLNGDQTHPIVMISGYIKKDEAYNGYIFYGFKHESISAINCSCTKGLMTLTLVIKDGFSANIGGVNVTQRNGHKTSDLSMTQTERRSEGAHWFEARTDDMNGTKKIYIREFHQHNGDNDTWSSDDWMGTDVVTEANIIAGGYAVITS